MTTKSRDPQLLEAVPVDVHRDDAGDASIKRIVTEFLDLPPAQRHRALETLLALDGRPHVVAGIPGQGGVEQGVGTDGSAEDAAQEAAAVREWLEGIESKDPAEKLALIDATAMQVSSQEAMDLLSAAHRATLDSSVSVAIQWNLTHLAAERPWAVLLAVLGVVALLFGVGQGIYKLIF